MYDFSVPAHQRVGESYLLPLHDCDLCQAEWRTTSHRLLDHEDFLPISFESRLQAAVIHYIEYGRTEKASDQPITITITGFFSTACGAL